MSNPYRETAGYGIHSVALQVKDLNVSLAWYQQVLGMEIVKETVTSGVSMTFIGYNRQMVPGTEFGQRQGLIQLIHVEGSENDPNFKINRDTNGFCHISISVPDVEAARNRAKSLGVKIVEEGSNSKGFAVLEDEDFYHIQLLSSQIHEKLELEKACEAIEPFLDIQQQQQFQLKDLEGNLRNSFISARGGSPELSHSFWSGNQTSNSISIGGGGGSNGSSGMISSPIESSFGETMEKVKGKEMELEREREKFKSNGNGSRGTGRKTTPDTPSQDR